MSLRINLSAAVLATILSVLTAQGTAVKNIAVLSSGQPAPAASKDSQRWWDVDISLDVQGGYEVRLYSLKYTGEFEFRIEWTGFMEEDEGDFLLYKDDCRIEHWHIEETAHYPEGKVLLETEDVLSAPGFSLKYLLKEKKVLFVDFFVEGFPIPQNSSPKKFPLILPCSAGNTDVQSLIDYDSYVMRGSNAIMLPTKTLSRAPIVGKFTWGWKYESWQEEQKKPVFLSMSHEAEFQVSITPQ